MVSTFFKRRSSRTIQSRFSAMDVPDCHAEVLESRRLLSAAVAFAAPQFVSMGFATDDVKLADLKKNGNQDIIAAAVSGESGFAVAMGNGDGTFQPSVNYPTPGSVGGASLVVADINGDGYPDVILSNQNSNYLLICLNNGQGQFPTSVKSTIDAGPAQMVTFAQSGHLCLAVACKSAGKIDFYYINSDGSLNIEGSITTASPYALSTFTSNGNLELAWTGGSTITNLAVPTLPIQNGTLSGTSVSLNCVSVGVATGVLENGQPGLVFTQSTVGYISGTQVGVFESATTLGSEQSYSAGGSLPTGVTVADMNGDGQNDIVTADEVSNCVGVLINQGNGNFGTALSFPAGSNPIQPVVGDLANNGLQDIVVAGLSTGVQVLMQEKQSLVVTTQSDHDDGNALAGKSDGVSLREAIEYAQTLNGPATITFSPSVFSTFSSVELNGLGTLNINDPYGLTIQAPPNSVVGIGAQGQQFTVMQNAAGSSLTLNGIILDGGTTSYVDAQNETVGGGLVNLGTMTMNDCQVDSNYGGYGDAIFNAGTLTMIDSSVMENNPQSTSGGYPVYNDQGTMTLEDDTIANNNEPGNVTMVNLAGTLQLTDTVVTGVTDVTRFDLVSSGGTVSGSNDFIGYGSTYGLANVLQGSANLSYSFSTGPATTLAPNAGSPLIDAGIALAGIATDERGIARPQGAAPDIGAVEDRQIAAPTFGSSTLNVYANASAVNLASAVGPNPTGGTFTGTGVTNNSFSPAGLNVGSYTITYVANSADNIPASSTFTVNVLAVSTTTTVTAQSGTYNGSAFPFASVSATGVNNFQDTNPADFTFNYQGTGSTSYGPTSTAPTHGGTYTVTATYTGKPGYNSSTSQPAAFTINKATVAVTVNSYNISTGTALANSQLTGTALNGTGGSVAGTFIFNTAAGTIPGIGANQSEAVTFTPSDGVDYAANNSASVSVNVTEAPSLVVTTTADSVNAYDGSTSLREAVTYAESLGGSQTITFAPGLGGGTIDLTGSTPSSAGPQYAAALQMYGNITIVGPATGLTLKADPSVAQRIILVNGGSVLTTSNLTFTGGNANGSFGGAVWAFGSFTATDCTFTGNTANEGAAIQSWGGQSPLLNLTNCTFTGNVTTGQASAISDGSASSTLEYDTITANTASNGFDSLLLFGNSVTMQNCIVAGNTNDGMQAGNGGGFSSQTSNNLLGTGTWGILQNGVNGNTLNVSNPGIATLANNGGPVETIAVLSTSPAMGMGVSVAGITTDARGLARPGAGGYAVGAYQPYSSYYLKLDADGVHTDLWTGSTTTGTYAMQLTASQINSLNLTEAGGAGTVTIDESAGNLLPSGGITVIGDGSTTLELIGTGSGDTVVSTGAGLQINGRSIGNTGISQTFYNPLTGTNNLNVSGGSLTIAQPLASTGITARYFSTVQIGSGAQLSMAAAISSSDRSLLDVSSLSIAGSMNNWLGRLDLANNDLIVTNGSLLTVDNQIDQGYANGSWTGSAGITSSAAASDQTHLRALGAIVNNINQAASGPMIVTGFDNQSVISSVVMVKYTYYGDANLDGKVDGSDYSRIDNGFLTHASGWYNGDFNYDSSINGSDYTLIDNAFNTQAASLSPATAVNFSAGFANAGSSIAFNGNALLSGNNLQLTANSSFQTSSAYYTSKLNVASFSTYFTFNQAAGAGDGFPFTIQNTGLTALGGQGGLLGYGGINNSLAIKFDLYDNSGEGSDSTGLYLNGAPPQATGSVDLSSTGITLHSGDNFQAAINYAGSTLNVVLTDLNTGTSAAQTYSINIASAIGSNTAWFGFSGATGGETAQQQIDSWTV